MHRLGGRALVVTSLTLACAPAMTGPDVTTADTDSADAGPGDAADEVGDGDGDATSSAGTSPETGDGDGDTGPGNPTCMLGDETIGAEGAYERVAYGPDGSTITIGRDSENWSAGSVIHKHDPSGAFEWEVYPAGEIAAVGVDASGHFATVDEFFVRRHAPDGSVLWARQPSLGDELAVHADGRVSVSGTLDVINDPQSTITTYDSNGSELWSVTEAEWTIVRTGLPDGGLAVIIGENFAWRVRTYDADGAQVWDVPVTGPANRPSVATDSSGNLYVAGTPFDSAPLWLRKLDAAGTVQWTVTDTLVDSFDRITGVGAWDGGAVVLGYEQGVDPITAFVWRVDDAGETVFLGRCNAGSDIGASAIAVHSDGEAAIVGVSVDRQWSARWRP